MARSAGVRLFEVDRDLGSFLNPEEEEEARHLTVPVRSVAKGPMAMADLVDDASTFGALVLDGILVSQVKLGGQVAARRLGPGDMIALPRGLPALLGAEAAWHAAVPSQVAVLGRAVSRAAQRWPELVGRLQARMGAECDRIEMQLAICQLPRVEDRVLAMLWLLAESWGHVTHAGTTLPLTLTHDVLGALVGARRPTVTLAVGELSDRGVIAQLDTGWLLLEPPAQPTGSGVPVLEPQLIKPPPALWRERPDASSDRSQDWHELIDTVHRLQEQHERQKKLVSQQMRRLRRSRQQSRSSRLRIAREGVTRRRTPS
jgi:CRP-like cAMP-binding protein